MSVPLRVLHCWSGNLYGGVESFLTTLAREPQAAPGLEQEYVLCFPGRNSDELRAAGAMVHQLAPVRFRYPWTVWRARRDLTRLFDDRRAEVVICHTSWPHLVFGPAVRRAGRGLVYWMHGCAGGMPRLLDQWVARHPPDLALANSHATAEMLPRVFPSGPPHQVLYYPVQPPAWRDDGERARARSAIRAALRTPAEAVVILQSCRLERYKGHTLLLDALGRLRDQPGWVAWIAGGVQRPHEQAYLDELQAQARTSGIAERVLFLGQRSDIAHLLAAADLHCQPNTGPEPFGIAFIEALYAGLPVVSTRLGGAAEIVTEACGRLVAPDDPGALAEALSTLIAAPDLRARLGAAGPGRARSLCDPPAILARLEALLRDVCSGSRHDARRAGHPLGDRSCGGG